MSAEIIAVFIGLLAGILGAYLQGRFSGKGSMKTELRSASRELVQAMAGALHSMCWISWSAKERGEVLLSQIEAYDKEIHQLEPQILGHLSSIACLDKELYMQLKELPWKVFDVDDRLSKLLIKMKSGSVEKKDVVELHEEVLRLSRAIPETITEKVSDRLSKPM